MRIALLAAVHFSLALPALPQASEVCSGDPAVVRVSTIKPGAMPAFLAAVAAHKAWYRANGVGDNDIFTAPVLVRDEATKRWKVSDTEVMSFHVRPPAAGRTPSRGDAAWNAYLKQYRDSSQIKSEYMVCMPKHGK